MENVILEAQPRIASPPVLPDPLLCRTCPIGTIEEFAECLVHHPAYCPHVLDAGSAYYCGHPHWRRFIQSPSHPSAAEEGVVDHRMLSPIP
jgi:hypothetical protein